MHDTLIFDILSIAGGIDQPYAVYPPEDGAGLKKLLDAIEGSQLRYSEGLLGLFPAEVVPGRKREGFPATTIYTTSVCCTRGCVLASGYRHQRSGM